MSAGLERVHLVVGLTRGMSLAAWRQAGILERELALYRALRPRLAGVTMLSYGDRADRPLAAAAGLGAVVNPLRLPQRLYAPYLCSLWRPPAGAVFKSNQVSGAEVPLAIARRAGRPFLARCGYLYSLNSEAAHGVDSAVAVYARDLERRVFTGADRVVVTTESIRAVVLARYGLTEEQVRVVPNYVDTELFRPLALDRTAAGDAGPDGPFRLAFVGRFSPEKNLAALFEALAGLEVELSLVGAGPQESELRELAQRLGLRANFLGLRPNPELPAWLNQAQAYVQPSLYEGHPKSLLEAMACGLPVLGGQVRGIRDVVEQGRTGLLAGTSAPEIRAAVVSLMDDPGLRQGLGRAARAAVVERYSLERVAGLEAALLAELAG